ncbi:uncharacterized protein TNIN_90901 [Trichonephila inaurata madagascariensis]|uniref:Uncharacterized protein n=1 Tax=Trichonephila inaurata madagascariensis TaxID=2747483 RepID=A0A8X6MDC2_9ARAC|nr:uncharacterized protein TNIN_294591 [Trichonephila inaurata madagascariensis]GFY64275.1 uncharacterized protein TNIN_90901 [Trichonephila inaurata madagascariensis]
MSQILGGPSVISGLPFGDRGYTTYKVSVLKDGAPPHYQGDVTAFLNRIFQGSWIRRGGPIAWPPRSLYLTPLDFFPWGFIKSIVCKQKISTVEELIKRIIQTIRLITPDRLRNTWRELDYHLNICRATKGAHIEI